MHLVIHEKEQIDETHAAQVLSLYTCICQYTYICACACKQNMCVPGRL